MLMEEYTVRLDRFCGPLDLLLDLIRQAEVDINEISVAQITDQYLEFVNRVQVIDIDVAADFLVIASTLVEIKSRILAPGTGSQRDADAGRRRKVKPDDPGADLIRQLLEYRRFRDAADALEERRRAWSRQRPVRRVSLDPSAELPGDDDHLLEDVGLYELMEAYRRIAETVIFDHLGAHEIREDETPIEVHAREVIGRLQALHVGPGETIRMPLRSVFADRSKSDVIGLFLAVLELARQRAVVVEPADRSIYLRLLEADPNEPSDDPVTFDGSDRP